MEYRTLGRTGLRVSSLCLGTVYFGTQVDEQEARRIINRALDLGVTFLDTAEIYMRPRYGISEDIVGRALAGRRHDVVLATKKRYDPAAYRTGTSSDHGLSRQQIITAIEGSLRRLRTDYVDLYYPHHVDPSVPFEESLGAFDDLVRSGKVRYVGLSNYPAYKIVRSLWIADARGFVPVACAQSLYNLLDRGAERELIPACQRFGLGLVPYSPLAGGVLSGKYGGSIDEIPSGSRAARGGYVVRGRPGHIPVLSERNVAIAHRLAAVAAEYGETAARLAVAWVLHQPAVTSTILGASAVDQLEQNVGAADIRLDQSTLAAIATCADD